MEVYGVCVPSVQPQLGCVCRWPWHLPSATPSARMRAMSWASMWTSWLTLCRSCLLPALSRGLLGRKIFSDCMLVCLYELFYDGRAFRALPAIVPSADASLVPLHIWLR